MRAARLYGKGDLRVENVPAPRIAQDDEVRLKVLAAGICGSDLHNFRTGQWITRTPSTPGHEFAAEVLETGAAVADLKPGDRVVADSRFSCGSCDRCLARRPNLCRSLGYVGEACDGGFAPEVVLPRRLLLPVDGAVAPEVAALAEPLAVALHAVRRLAAEPGAPVLVTGGGPIGGLAALLLGRAGHSVRLVERNVARAGLVARVSGATSVPLDATAWDGVALAIEATGSAAVAGAVLSGLATGGRAVLVGIFHEPLSFDANLVVERELVVSGCSAFGEELPEAVGLLPALAPWLAQLVEGPIGLEELPGAYARLMAGEATGLKTILRP